MKTGIQFLILSFLMLALSSCGSSSSTSAGRGGVMEGGLTLKITDAPVDGALAVWIQFSGVTIKPANGSAFDIIFDTPLDINLLSLQAGKTEVLLENVKLTPGKYNWIRLHVNATRDSVLDSYIILADGRNEELNIPASAEIGLQIINDIEIASNKDVNLIIDFDLRRSVVESAGAAYDLLPVLKIVNADNMVSLHGTIDPLLLMSADCSDALPNTGNAVYVFAGKDAAPADMNVGNTNLVATANVMQNIQTGDYEYIVSCLEPGEYTVAFTCQADQDQPDARDNIIFSMVENVEVAKESNVVTNMR